jgi:predicted PhzF superfamily epimerase YddE/YHI9
VLWTTGYLWTSEEARFYTKSGLLTARHIDGWIELDFPAERAKVVDAPPGLVAALGVTPRTVARNRFDYLVEAASEEEVRQAQPDLAALKQVDGRGVILTGPSRNGRYDFVSRFFAPAAGIDEDPVTGSAHCCLAPFWAERLGKLDITGYQASPRGGAVRVRVAGERVLLSGQAVLVLRGTLV